MRLNQLEIIIAVNHYKSMGIASEQLNISKQNISKNILALEEELDCQLFFRSNKGVFPTKDGEIVLAYAQDILDKTNQLQQKLHPLAKDDPAQCALNLLMSQYFIPYVHQVISEMILTYPLLNIHITTEEALLITHQLNQTLAEPYHLIFTAIPSGQLAEFIQNSQYQLYPLKEGRLSIFTNVTSPLSGRKSIYLHELSTLPLVMSALNNNSLGFPCSYLDELKIPLNIKYNVNSFDFVRQHLLNGSAYALGDQAVYDDIIPKENQEQIITIPIKEKINWFYTCLVSKHLSDNATIYIEEILQKLSAFWPKISALSQRYY